MRHSQCGFPWWPCRPLATLDRKSRQGRKAATVSIDAGASNRRTIRGTVTWVSSEAEFTPTPIQTRDERKDLVYAIKIAVPNPSGTVKIGMPADVRFTP